MIDQYIHQYGKRLYGLCLTLCANTLEADDLYQDTWLQVVKNFSRYDASRDFEPWLTKICVNLYRNALRRLSKSPFLHFRSNEEKEFLLCSIPAPEKVDYRPLYEAIDHLPEKYRLAVILYYFDDRNIAATAQILGIPSGTVKSRLDKARKLLKEALGNMILNSARLRSSTSKCSGRSWSGANCGFRPPSQFWQAFS